MTWPVRMPPPASRAKFTGGQWSRPAFLLILGVRPNSPQTTTETSLSSPRWYRSSTSADRAMSSLGMRGCIVSKLLTVRVPAAERDRHDPRTRLDQPPGHQEVVHAARRAVVLVGHVADAVAGAQTGIFLGDVEGLEDPARRQHLEGPLSEAVHADASRHRDRACARSRRAGRAASGGPPAAAV